MPNNIAINGRCFSRRVTGVERYAREISKRLTSSRIIQPKNNPGRVAGNLWEQIILPTQIRQNEILWSPANAGPWFFRNQVITIHDASVFDHPEWFQPSFAAWTRLSWKILAKRVKAIITVSNYSCERLKFHLGIPEENIHVIHNGVGRPFEPQSQKTIDSVGRKYKLDKPYFLFVGTIEPRKNLPILLQAWESLNLKTHSLFIAGTEGRVFANDEGRETRPRQKYISDEDLPALYSGATAFVVPSFYEGFGLTALEAMACGAPVIASNTTALPEILGDAALLIDPKDPVEISNAMQKIIEDRIFANTLRERGLQLTKNFTWDQAARKIKSLLEGIQ
jgi:glycosyltransferase involved in cell wall biosynthesis